MTKRKALEVLEKRYYKKEMTNGNERFLLSRRWSVWYGSSKI